MKPQQPQWRLITKILPKYIPYYYHFDQQLVLSIVSEWPFGTKRSLIISPNNANDNLVPSPTIVVQHVDVATIQYIILVLIELGDSGGIRELQQEERITYNIIRCVVNREVV